MQNTRKYYEERATHLLQIAHESQIEKMRETCLKAADVFLSLAMEAAATDKAN